MIGIAITPAAFDAVAATLVLGTVAVEPERDEDGSVRAALMAVHCSGAGDGGPAAG
jgi:hypothetical protein